MDIVVVTCATFHMHTGLWNHTGIAPGPEMQSPIHSLQVISRGTSQHFIITCFIWSTPVNIKC